VVISVVEEQGLYEVTGLVDDNPALRGSDVYGYRVTGDRDDSLGEIRAKGIRKALVAIGDNRGRLAAARWAEEKGFGLVTAVHPSARVARGVAIGGGTVLMAGTIVNPDAVIGKSVVLNTAATVDHDCVIGDGAHLAPGCRLCGNVRVGRASFLGVGTCVVPGITIGDDVVIGAGSVVIRDIPSGARVAGNPCRALTGEESRNAE